jgi:hypothetical protein
MKKAAVLTLFGLLLAACAASAATPTATLPPPQVSLISPTPSLTPPPTATLTPTPQALNPLTGLPVSDPAVLNRRPLAIKVAHFPRKVREYQVGLASADQVWEHYAEGGVTRFTAIYLSQGPLKVGNVRSARLVDAALSAAYEAMLVTSGSSEGTLNRLRENPALYRRVIAEATGYSLCPLLCREEAATLTTDKLFTSPEAVWRLAEQMGLGGAPPLAGFAFDALTPANGVPALTIHLDFQRDNTVAEWRYDQASGRYARWIDTDAMPALAPHVDQLNGQAITAANIVVLYAAHVPSNIHEEEDGKRYFSYDIVLTGTGSAKLFRDGQAFDVLWFRPDAGAGLPRFVDPAGAPVPFRPGNTWFEILSTGSPTEFSADVFRARFLAPDPFPATPAP